MKKKTVIKPLVVCFNVLLMMSISTHVVAEQEEGSAAMESCQAMMEQHQAMKAASVDASARLHALIDVLDSSQGEEKSEALVAAVREIAAQLDTMHGRMTGMSSRGRMHMMTHMHAKSGAMAECPMMQGMMAQGSAPGDAEADEGPEAKSAADEHKGHH